MPVIGESSGKYGFLHFYMKLESASAKFKSCLYWMTTTRASQAIHLNYQKGGALGTVGSISFQIGLLTDSDGKS